MDCCNYMPYRHHHQGYYGTHYYDPLPAYHHDDYYHRGATPSTPSPSSSSIYHPDYYANPSHYYPQHWQCAPSSFQDYVYNPKEARIRKAMREATRDRSIGASPMLPRPSARRATHGWVSAHEEPLLMSPLGGMRGPLESNVCFPLTPDNNQPFITPPPPPPPTHSNYMQPNPLAQLQQHTEMWENYQQDGIRPRSGGNPYMMSEVTTYQSSPPDGPLPLLMDKHQRQTHSVSSTSMSMTPPHSNENVPPDEPVTPQDKPSTPESHSSEAVQQQSLMETNTVPTDQFMTSGYQQQRQMELKVKKPLPDFNEAFGSTERGRFQSPPDPRLAKGYLDYYSMDDY